MRYFVKSLVYNTIQSSDGRSIPFIEGAAGIGLLATEDAVFIADMEARIREKRGGVREMSKDMYDEELKKKNASRSLLPPLTRQGLTLGAVQAQAQPRPAAPAVVAASAAEKVSTPTPATPPAAPDDTKISRPTVGKLKR